MQQRFLGQPFDESSNLVDFIHHATDQQFTELKIAVAWAKRSGLGRILDDLDKFRQQGGHVSLIIGVSEGGASKEGLELALEAADESFVFHDPHRTFHPKVYLGRSDTERSLLVGSSNLTAGGLSWNYEASLWLDWAPGEADDLEDSVNRWFDKLHSEPESCKELTAELIQQMQDSRDISIGSELGARRHKKRNSDAPEDNDSKVTATIDGLFTAISQGLRRLPGLSSRLTPLATPAPIQVTPASSTPNAQGQPAGPISGSDAALPVDDVTHRWFKVMDHTAAQQVKSANTNPTGNLRLSQGEADINHRIYFHNTMFGGLPWTPTAGKTTEQEVVVKFHVWVDGTDFGEREIRLSHDPHRISGQGNVPTVLHWGPLSPLLRSTNYIGYYVTLERVVGGGYNLVVSREPRGGYIV
ncbi:hypothetical protein FAM19024_002405 [Propionibacterium freudenreichii]|uniref:phospholipase D family protein n=1 Tax=Propionibacterium freudenreichii TaxID=1744 RepID=UPI0024345512|nr:phospholipase D family protein [Propionibacterium freudenreichii]WFF32857.1 hypothetical protein FAM19024_002405 [Propionibacterium freudenreichii]